MVRQMYALSRVPSSYVCGNHLTIQNCHHTFCMSCRFIDNVHLRPHLMVAIKLSRLRTIGDHFIYIKYTYIALEINKKIRDLLVYINICPVRYLFINVIFNVSIKA